MYCDNARDSYDVYQCTRFFKRAVHIRGTPQSSIRCKPHTRRLLGMASQHISNQMEFDASSTDKENGSATCNSHNYTPQKVVKKSRCPLEDCDPNSQDSGYGASFVDKDEKRDGFQFAEPSGVAPRRMSMECRSPMGSRSPMESRSPIGSRSPMGSRSPIQSRSPMGSRSPIQSRSPMGSRSPMESPVRSSPQLPHSTGASFFRSLSSGYESMDDGFNELIDVDTLDDATQLPSNITTLLSGDIVRSEMECNITTTPEYPRTKCAVTLRRSLSYQGETCDKNTPTLSKVRSCLFHSPNAASSMQKLRFNDYPQECFYVEMQSPQLKSFKRPEPPAQESPKLVKKSRKSHSMCHTNTEATSSPKPILMQRSVSETEAQAQIKSAVHRSTTDADLTGDFSKPCILPLAVGIHDDLKSISADTLAALIRGEFDDRVASFKIVDCRYPYEFDGGHIEGAMNLYSRDLIEQVLLDPLTRVPEIGPDTDKRSIIIFHCEFSKERGPNLSRFLRNLDRQRNKECYPALYYPEIYLLHAGYRQFFLEQKEFCSPQGYRPMRHPDHEADLKQFRSKSKSWQGERVRLSNGYPTRNLKRLGF